MAGGFLQLELIMIMNSKSGCFPGSGCQGDKHHKQLVPRFQRPGWGTGRMASVGSDLRQASTWEMGKQVTWGASPSVSSTPDPKETPQLDVAGEGASGCSLSSDQRWDPSFETGGGTARS